MKANDVSVGDRLINIAKGLGGDALDEIKTGVDKAWGEIKIGMDDAVQAAADGFTKGWAELATGIERAKDNILFKDDHIQTQTGGRKSVNRERENLN